MSGPISAQATEFNFMANKVCQTTIAERKVYQSKLFVCETSLTEHYTGAFLRGDYVFA
jgi:hypothetical protein